MLIKHNTTLVVKVHRQNHCYSMEKGLWFYVCSIQQYGHRKIMIASTSTQPILCAQNFFPHRYYVYTQYYICSISFYVCNMIISDPLPLCLYTTREKFHITTINLSYANLKESIVLDYAHNTKQYVHKTNPENFYLNSLTPYGHGNFVMHIVS